MYAFSNHMYGLNFSDHYLQIVRFGLCNDRISAIKQPDDYYPEIKVLKYVQRTIVLKGLIYIIWQDKIGNPQNPTEN